MESSSLSAAAAFELEDEVTSSSGSEGRRIGWLMMLLIRGLVCRDDGLICDLGSFDNVGGGAGTRTVEP